MKNMYNKIWMVGIAFLAVSCNLTDIENPNAPTFESFEDGVTLGDARLQAIGLEAVMRNDLHFHYQTVSILGREYYDLTGVDPRFTQEILKGPLDNNGFLTTRAYAAWYKIVQSANLLEKAVTNSSVEAGFTDEVKAGYFGYAQTLKAYALMMVANRQYTNGIRTEVADIEDLGPFRSYADALADIQALLGTANTNLANAGEAFDFTLSSGFAGFDSTATYATFNRAIAARIAIYQGDKAVARSALGNSFLDLNGTMDTGPAHIFGLTGNDIANALFYIPNQSGQEFMAHDSFVAEAEDGDNRVAAKVGLFLVDDPDDDPDEGPQPERQSFDDLSADFQVRMYSNNIDPVPIIRNEELILLWAEAHIGFDNTEAVNALNVIRNAAGLADYSDATSDDALEDELINQRRYSLFGEGHRWIDMRRYDRLDELPTDRPGDNVLDAFPTPVNEGEELGGG